MIIKHKFQNYHVPEDTEILIVGTFNPDKIDNEAEFFYGRNRNFLWRILSESFGVDDLKPKSKEEKEKFAVSKKIGFIDLIKTVDYEDEKVDYDDIKLDCKTKEWNSVDDLVKKLPYLKKVIFTRKNFAGIPNIKEKIAKLQKVCLDSEIDFACLSTPARFINEKKLLEWKKFLLK